MAILRAGPWATIYDQFLNEPEDPGSISSDGVPVNCANSYSATWPWRCIFYWNEFDTSPSVEGYGVETVTNTFTLSKGSGHAVQAEFSYQATEDWSFSSGSMNASDWAEVYIDGVQYGLSSSSLDLTDIVFPASVVPVFVDMNCGGNGPESATITFTL